MAKDLSKFKDILATEWSSKFEEAMKCAIINSYYKYGKASENYGKYKCLDARANLRKRLEEYEKTGNTEFLVDVANFAMLEFMFPSVEGARYEPTSTDAVETIGFGINQIRAEAAGDK